MNNIPLIISAAKHKNIEKSNLFIMRIMEFNQLIWGIEGIEENSPFLYIGFTFSIKLHRWITASTF